MKLRKIISLAAAFITAVSALPVKPIYAAEPEQTEVSVSETLPYKNTALSFEERAADLVSRMTLEEKVAQLGRNAPAISRLGVSKYNYWREAIHGVARQGRATSFPSSLSMSNTWDVALMEQAMDITSTEARGKNSRRELSYWNPTINMARDPRWGRNEETYGEDPYLTSQLGGAAVRGMQGDDDKYLKTISTIKHFAANNNENDRQVGTSVMSEKTLREYYTKAFGDIVEKEHPGSVMSSYNGITMSRCGEMITDYIASSANPYLLTDVLRRTYGFDGYVVGDCGAWSNLFGRDTLKQKLFPDWNIKDITQAMTTAKAIEAGNNLDCGNDAYLAAYDAVEQGLLDEDDIDRAVYELFLARMRTGEFDDGARYQDITADVIETDENVAVAEKAAEESWVLLENRNDTLPLKPEVSRIAVVGSFADKLVLGDYSGEPTKISTPVEGIRSAVAAINPDAEVQYLSAVAENEPLYNIKSITLVRNDGTRVGIDLSKAQDVSGMTLENGMFTNVTPKASAYIPNVDFRNTKTIEAEISTGGMIGGILSFAYGKEGTVASIRSTATADTETYAVCSGAFDGQGGYDQISDMYISAASMPGFSIDNYRSQLDAADYIIAYASTIPKEEGLGEPDARESKDRESIDLPAHESHVQELCDAYPDKTVVVMSTVGQINVEPFRESCAAILWTSYNGQAQGEALGKILTGAASPSGRLSTTWYAAADLEKMPVGAVRETINGISYRFADYEIAQRDGFPGRTYQYYGGEPVYPFGYGKSYTSFEYSDIAVSSDSADANDIVTVTANVTNTGTAAGAETAQLYVAVPGADGVNLPLKQLKGFKRVELEPGESAQLSFEIDISDVCFFDEISQSEYVVNGEYTIRIGANSNDPKALEAKLSVSGSIADEIEHIRAVPTGITVYGAYDGTAVQPVKSVKAQTSVTKKNHALISDVSLLDDVMITYQSSNENIASVTSDGIVNAGNTEGTALITVTAVQGDKTVSDSFPVVMQLKESISDAKRAEYIERLDNEYGRYIQKAYTPENWEKLDNIYMTARNDMQSELIEENFAGLLEAAVSGMAAIEKMPLERKYIIRSKNPKVVVNGSINYSEDGIGTYTTGESAISGTFTESEPLVTELEAFDGTEPEYGVIWNVEKLDSSSRKAPSINGGELTVYENGTFRVTASNYDTKEYGELIIHANLQIEGEAADDAAGANAADVKNGASNGGLNVGSTGSSWMRYDGVKISQLTAVRLRVSQKETESDIKLSLIPGDDGVFASAKAPVTGAWDKWTEVPAEVNRNELSRAKLDENGCGTIYVQTNGANLDYMMLEYINSDMDIFNQAGGRISVTVPYNNGRIIAAKYNDNGTLKNVSVKEITAPGEYGFDGFSEDEKVTFMAWDSLENMKPLTNSVKHIYRKPVVKTLTVFNFSDAAYDSFFDSAEGAELVSGTGLDGYGAWATQTRTFNVVYGDKEYTFTRGLKGGGGNRTSKCVYFTPAADGVVTVYLEASTDRKIIIDQGSNKTEGFGKGDRVITAIEMKVSEGEPVYIYGGGSNKQIYAVFFDTQKELSEPDPSPSPSPDPMPPIDREVSIEFEDYTKAWTKSSTKSAVADASGGFVIDNTRAGDIFFFGERELDSLAGINLYSGTRATDIPVCEFFAVEMSKLSAVDLMDQSAVDALLTSDNSLGKVTIAADDKSWNNFKDNIIRVHTNRTGKYGIFMKAVSTTNKYCGNHDYIKLMYSK